MSSPLRVLHIITSLNPGGAETMLLKLARALPRDDFECSVLTLLDGGRLTADLRALDVDVEELGVAPRTLLRALGALRQHVQRLSPDVIHGWMPHGNVTAWLAGRLFGTHPAVIWSVRQSLYTMRSVRPLTAALIRLGAVLSSSTDCVIYNSLIGARHHERVGFARKRRRVIPNGFDCERFRPRRDARVAIRAELGIAETDPVIGVIARYHPMKDHETFLHAAARVAVAHPRAQFVLAGTGITWNNAALRTVTESLTPLRGRVHLLGDRVDVESITAALDVACLSSWTEAFPNVLGEAMACGVPCVATDVGEARDIVGDTGLIVPPRDIPALANALGTMLSLPIGALRDCGDRARGRIVDHYSLGRVASAYADVYREVVGARHPVAGPAHSNRRHAAA